MRQIRDVRRHKDGSINFDFYWRRAARYRRFIKRLFFRRCLALAAVALKASSHTIIKPEMLLEDHCGLRATAPESGIVRAPLRDAFSGPFWENPTALLRERAIVGRLNRVLTEPQDATSRSHLKAKG